MKAVIIAGGVGERLKPLTDTIPKPMVEVSGKPVLEHVVNLFKKYYINEYIFTVCHLHEKITSYFGDGSKFKIKIDYVFEDPFKPLGTAGGLAKAKRYLHDDFIVTSGDTLRNIDITKIIKFHKDKSSFATLNVYKRYGNDPKSMVVFDKDNKINDFVERPSRQETNKDFVWANGSFYIFRQEIVSYIPENKKIDFGKDVFPHLLMEKKDMYAYPTNDYLIDIGNLEKLERARKTFRF